MTPRFAMTPASPSAPLRALLSALLVASLLCSACERAPERSVETPPQDAAPFGASEPESEKADREDQAQLDAMLEQGRFIACQRSIVQARSPSAGVAERNEMIASGCAPLFGQAPCREAFERSEETFWDRCLEAYCPLLERASTPSPLCAIDQEARNEALNEVAERATFIVRALAAERPSMPPLEEPWMEGLRLAFSADEPLKRQMAFATYIADVQQSEALTTEQKNLLAVALMLSSAAPMPSIDRTPSTTLTP